MRKSAGLQRRPLDRRSMVIVFPRMDTAALVLGVVDTNIFARLLRGDIDLRQTAAVFRQGLYLC
jgi:hypothetical protein